MLLPFYIWEITHSIPIVWNESLLLIILYLGIGTSVIAFLCWNAAIARLGAGRTALFGNLIPVFSGFEAVLILNEKISFIHIFSGALVITGLVIATLQHPVRKFEAVTK
jgi:drug/metabolite transporter (DMT)-like permease